MGIEIYGGKLLYSMGDFNIVWGDYYYIVWEILRKMGDFYIVLGILL